VRAPSPPGLPPLAWQRVAVRDCRPLDGLWEVWLDWPGDPPLAGQFLMVDTGRSRLLLPLTAFRHDPQRRQVSVLVRGDAVARSLLGRQEVACLGPLGRPFPQEPCSKALLAAEAGHLAPLWALARDLVAQGVAVHLFLPAPGARALAEAFSQVGAQVKTSTEASPWPAFREVARRLYQEGEDTRAYAAGPWPALSFLSREVVPTLAARTFVFVESPMACGVGACLGCAVPWARPGDARQPYARPCVHGPAFRLADVRLDEEGEGA
jgi:dihydroorotate dehydrogenase electron transfer subunit